MRFFVGVFLVIFSSSCVENTEFRCRDIELGTAVQELPIIQPQYTSSVGILINAPSLDCCNACRDSKQTCACDTDCQYPWKNTAEYKGVGPPFEGKCSEAGGLFANPQGETLTCNVYIENEKVVAVQEYCVN